MARVGVRRRGGTFEEFTEVMGLGVGEHTFRRVL